MKNKSIYLSVLFALLTFFAAYLGSLIERDFGQIEVNTVHIMTEEMQPMVAKLVSLLSAAIW